MGLWVLAVASALAEPVVVSRVAPEMPESVRELEDFRGAKCNARIDVNPVGHVAHVAIDRCSLAFAVAAKAAAEQWTFAAGNPGTLEWQFEFHAPNRDLAGKRLDVALPALGLSATIHGETPRPPTYPKNGSELVPSVMRGGAPFDEAEYYRWQEWTGGKMMPCVLTVHVDDTGRIDAVDEVECQRKTFGIVSRRLSKLSAPSAVPGQSYRIHLYFRAGPP